MRAIPVERSGRHGARFNLTETKMIHDFFNWCVWVLEVIGHQTGWGYELANIIIFVIIEPTLIVLFFVMWIRERKIRRQLAGIEGLSNQ